MPAVVFLTALAVRCAIVFQLDGTAIFRTPQLDSVEYFSWAERIASGDFSWPAAPPHGPGYPLFLGLLLFICRGSLFAVHLLQAILGSITAVMIAAIANRVAGEKAGLAAGVFAALYGPMALVDVSIYGEGLLVFLITASLLAVIEAQTRCAGGRCCSSRAPRSDWRSSSGPPRRFSFRSMPSSCGGARC